MLLRLEEKAWNLLLWDPKKIHSRCLQPKEGLGHLLVRRKG